jgi:S1-C subfamily serine protease
MESAWSGRATRSRWAPLTVAASWPVIAIQGDAGATQMATTTLGVMTLSLASVPVVLQAETTLCQEAMDMLRRADTLFVGLIAGLLVWALAVLLPNLQAGEDIAWLPVRWTSAPDVETVSSEAGARMGDMPTPMPLSDDVLASAYAEEQLRVEVYRRVSPSVVTISVADGDGREGRGTGFLWDTEGHIVTNNHVIVGAEQILVHFADGITTEATLVAYDADVDLAVLRADVPVYTPHPIELGDSDELNVGQRAIVIGSPFGLKQTMTEGIVSALGRRMLQANGTPIAQLIQTDAPINPGNSGGPLLDSRGRAIGIITIMPTTDGTNSGVALAVPINTVKSLVPSLIAAG